MDSNEARKLTTPKRTPGEASSFVTQEQFDGFVSHVDQRFTSLGHAIGEQSASIRDLAKQWKDSSKPQYAAWIAGIAVIMSMAGMGAALVANSITASQQLGEAQDKTLQVQLSNLERGSNRYSLDDHRFYAEEVDEKFDSLDEQSRQMAVALSALAERVSGLNDWQSRSEVRTEAALRHLANELQERAPAIHAIEGIRQELDKRSPNDVYEKLDRLVPDLFKSQPSHP